MTYNEFLLGKSLRLSWVDETSYGTGGDMAADGEVIGLNAVIESDFDQNWQEILSDGSSSRTVESHELGALTLPFTLVFTPVNWKFLRYCGYEFTNTVSGDDFIHTGTLVNTVQSFKMEAVLDHTTPVVTTLTGCVVTGAEINFSKGTDESMITVSLSCIAQGVSFGSTKSTLASGTITRSPFHFRNVKITNNNNEIVEVNNGSISIDQGIDPEDSRYCNSTLDREIGEPIPKVHRISGTYNVNIKDSTEFNQWADGVEITNCKLELIKTATDYLTLGLDGFRIQKGPPPISLDGVVNMDIAWKCDKFDPIEAKDDLDTY
jgi:hypothetical protein